MAVVQEAFEIPAEIATGLLTGEYRRLGGVVRYAVGPHKGQIVKHLKPVDVREAEAAKGALAKGVQLVKGNPKAAIVVGAGMLIAGGGAFVYKKIKNREPAVLKEFREALRLYLEAIKSGNMEIDVINGMFDALQALKQHADYEQFSIALTADDIETLVNKIHEYTIKLAADNEIDIEEIDDEESGDAIIDLEKYLNIQKKVFEEAA